MPDQIVYLDAQALNPGDLEWDILSRHGDFEAHPRTPSDDIAKRIGGATIVLTNKAMIDADVIAACPNLKYIGVTATGVNIVDLDAATARGITVTNAPGYSSESVAQHVFALLFALTNRIDAHHQSVQAGGWVNSPDFAYTLEPIYEMAGKTLAVVGLGDIGTRVARIGQALGMKIAGWQRPGREPKRIDGIDLRELPLDELFAAADVVTLHCPLTDETRHMVNAERLSKMKPSALLINTGRGPLLDEAAVAAALRDGTIAGAGVDVLSTEPPAPDNPMLTAPNCIITPHNAWASVEARKRLLNIVADNVRAFLNGQPTNVVND